MFELVKTHYAILVSLKNDERGVTAMEYGLIAALISVIVIGALTTIGTRLLAKFNAVAAGLV